jgi:hypothetical protein
VCTPIISFAVVSHVNCSAYRGIFSRSYTRSSATKILSVGLTCGQLKSKHFTDYIADLAGVQGEVTGVRYRGKSPDQPAINYHYVCTTADGEERRIFWNEGIAEAWTNR